MNFDLSGEQVAFADTLSRFVDDRYDALQRESHLSQPKGFDPAIWQELAHIGLIALRQHEDDGGLGGSTTDLYVAMRSLGRGLILDPWLTSLVASRLITSLGSQKQKAHWLPRLADGSATIGLALTEAGPAHPLAHVSATYAVDAEAVALSGRKKAAISGAAEQYIVLAHDETSEALQLFIVPVESPGLARRQYRAVDGSLICDLELSACEVARDAALGAAEHTPRVVEDALAEAFVALCAEALGIMEHALSETIEHLKLRTQFGTPLASFQVLQHRMADCATEIELIKGLAMKAALLADDKESSRTEGLMAAVGLKALTSRVARLVAEETVQLHGAMGITEELWIGRAMKRLLMISLLFGDERSQTRYADTLRTSDH